MATEENVECEVDGRPVSKLKVDELKVELDKRGLKKSGVKKELQERLIEVRKRLGLCSDTEFVVFV